MSFLLGLFDRQVYWTFRSCFDFFLVCNDRVTLFWSFVWNFRHVLKWFLTLTIISFWFFFLYTDSHSRILGQRFFCDVPICSLIRQKQHNWNAKKKCNDLPVLCLRDSFVLFSLIFWQHAHALAAASMFFFYLWCTNVWMWHQASNYIMFEQIDSAILGEKKSIIQFAFHDHLRTTIWFCFGHSFLLAQFCYYYICFESTTCFH